MDEVLPVEPACEADTEIVPDPDPAPEDIVLVLLALSLDILSCAFSASTRLLKLAFDSGAWGSALPSQVLPGMG